MSQEVSVLSMQDQKNTRVVGVISRQHGECRCFWWTGATGIRGTRLHQPISLRITGWVPVVVYRVNNIGFCFDCTCLTNETVASYWLKVPCSPCWRRPQSKKLQDSDLFARERESEMFCVFVMLTVSAISFEFAHHFDMLSITEGTSSPPPNKCVVLSASCFAHEDRSAFHKK